ncbi:MAG: hypothetical protein HGA51_09520 [Demequinaceae bacterium]|nr:hypothetical protein [Demequinaceae bacterium]
MNTRLPFAPAALVAGACLLFLGGCAGERESPPALDTTIPSAAPADGGAAGIQLAQPSDAPDPGVAAKRRAPEAVGTVASMTFGEDSVQVVFTPDAGYEYFAGTTFDIPFSAATAIDGETAVVLGDLKAGDRINVWTGACRESQPVQCDVEAVTAAL